jgi:hypothetical protein
VGNTSKNDTIKSVMTEKRQKHTEVIERFRHKDQMNDEFAQSIEDAKNVKQAELEASSQVRGRPGHNLIKL